MDPLQVVASLGALAHETRLAVYRLLVQKGPDGLSAGALAAAVGLAPSSLTFHLQQLTQAGLIKPRRVSRQLIYATDYSVMNAVLAYLGENCCGSATACSPTCRPEIAGAAPNNRRTA